MSQQDPRETSPRPHPNKPDAPDRDWARREEQAEREVEETRQRPRPAPVQKD